MAAARTRKRRSTKAAPKIGKESWLIVGPNNEVLRESSYGEGASLALAQTLAQKYDEEVTLTVRWKALFGDPVDLYHVTQDADGVIITFTL